MLTVVLAAVFGSPDEQGMTLKKWADAAPADFVATAVQELAGTSGTASYGPPYNATPDAAQKVGPLAAPEAGRGTDPGGHRGGLRDRPADAAAGEPGRRVGAGHLERRTPDQQAAWATAYDDALAKAPTATREGRPR